MAGSLLNRCPDVRVITVVSRSEGRSPGEWMGKALSNLPKEFAAENAEDPEGAPRSFGLIRGARSGGAERPAAGVTARTAYGSGSPCISVVLRVLHGGISRCGPRIHDLRSRQDKASRWST